MKPREEILAVEGPAAPPRSNGELVFEEPWQARIFGVTLSLYEDGRFDWPEFQSLLIEAIAEHEARRGEGAYDYYGCWLEALRRLVEVKDWVDSAGLMARESEFLDRPAGHDHG